MQTEESYSILLLDTQDLLKNRLLSFTQSWLQVSNIFIRVGFVTEI